MDEEEVEGQHRKETTEIRSRSKDIVRKISVFWYQAGVRH